jgi:CHAT domain-containing protein
MHNNMALDPQHLASLGFLTHEESYTNKSLSTKAIDTLKAFLKVQESLVKAESLRSKSDEDHATEDLNILLEGARGIRYGSGMGDESELNDVPFPKALDPIVREELLSAAEVLKDFYKHWEKHSYIRWRKEWSQYKMRMHEGSWWLRQEDTFNILMTTAQILGRLSYFSTACSLYDEAMKGLGELRMKRSHEHYRLDYGVSPLFRRLYFLAARTALKWHLSTATEDHAEGFSPHLQQAFTYLERGTDRVLLDHLETTLNPGWPTGIPDGTTANTIYRRCTAALAARREMLTQAYRSEAPDNSRITQLRNEISKLEIEVEDAAASPGMSTARVDIIRLQNVTSMLPGDTAILQYCYEDTASLLHCERETALAREIENFMMWKITSQGISSAIICTVPIADLEDRINKYHSQCGSASEISRENETFLAEQLLPSSMDLSEITHLIIIPHRTLHLLPFHVLPYKGKPLIASCSVSYIPSASSYCTLKEGTYSRPRKILAIGNPSNMSHTDLQTGETNSLTALPGADVEARYISRFVPDSRSLVGAEASKASIYSMINNYSILHIATHGEVCTNFPTLSAIALAEGDSITVEELIGRKLTPELVVLSACYTGQGGVAENNDVIGFSRALIAAGTKTVLVSLWPVDDATTTFFMEQFYKRFTQGEPAAMALQAAQMAVFRSQKTDIDEYLIKLRRTLNENVDRRLERPMARMSDRATTVDYRHPKYWAPFVLVGAGSCSSDTSDPVGSQMGTAVRRWLAFQNDERLAPQYFDGDPRFIGMQWSNGY